jgi:hypothetical protein
MTDTLVPYRGLADKTLQSIFTVYNSANRTLSPAKRYDKNKP